MEKQKGIQKLDEALLIIERVIKEKGGTFKVVQKATVISGDA